jgi:hypothetical protein
VVKSLAGSGCGPVVLIPTQNFQFFLKKKTHFVVEGYKATYGHKAARLNHKWPPAANETNGHINELK